MLDNEAILQLRLEHAQQHIEQQNYLTALIELEETLDQSPNCFEAKFLLGQAYLMSQNPIVAELAFRDCLNDPLSDDFAHDIYLSLALSLFYQYRFEEALERIKKAQTYNVQNPILFKYKALIQDRLGYPLIARVNNITAHKISTTHIPLAHWELAEDYQELNDLFQSEAVQKVVSEVIWAEFPEKPAQLSRGSIPPNQVLYYNHDQRLHIFYGNLKFVGANLAEIRLFLEGELDRLTRDEE